MFWKRRMIMRLSYQETENNQLEAMLPHIDILSDSVPVNALGKFPGCRDVIVTRPTPTYLFLHEAAVIGYHGVLFASWYNCPAGELRGYTPIRGAKSFDGGKTWTEPEDIAFDPSGKLLYCPPIYGICDDTLVAAVGAAKVQAKRLSSPLMVAPLAGSDALIKSRRRSLSKR